MHFRKNHVRKEELTEDGELPVGNMFDRNRFNRSTILNRLALDEAIVQLPPTAIARSLSCMTLKGWNIVKSHRSWAARSEHPSRNYIELG